VFLPLFSMLDITAKGEAEVVEMFCIAFDLLVTALQLGPHMQAAFDNANGFAILSALLLSSKSCALTYSLYTIFGTLADPALQRALLCDVLVNVDLVAAAQGRIVKHWTNTIRATYREAFDHVLPTRTILSAVAMHYARDERAAVRSRLLELVLVQARAGIGLDELKLLLSMAITATGDYCHELLGLIRSVLMVAGRALQALPDDGMFWTTLTSLMPFIQMVEVLLEVHALGLIRPLSRQLHAEMIIHEVTPTLVDRDVLSFLTARVNEGAI
jgi:hypothetical protein